jgi:hypothetical protein
MSSASGQTSKRFFMVGSLLKVLAFVLAATAAAADVFVFNKRNAAVAPVADLDSIVFDKSTNTTLIVLQNFLGESIR